MIAEDEDFTVTADDYWLHTKCAVERPAHPQPCPDGDACPDARRWGNVHQQPAPADVPPMPPIFPAGAFGKDERACPVVFVSALHAVCVRIAQERDELARENANHCEGEALWRNAEHAERARADKAEAELEAEREKAERYRLDALRLDGNAFRERARADKAEAELEAERAGRPGSINAMTITSLRERLAEAEAELAALQEAVCEFLPEYDIDGDGEATANEVERIEYAGEELRKAEAELAALKAQEPVGIVWAYTTGSDAHIGRVRWINTPVPVRYEQPLYAAPVPAPDSVPREQHEAEVAQARREERERCAKRCDEITHFFENSTDIHELHARERDTARSLAAAIRALAEKGGEVGK